MFLEAAHAEDIEFDVCIVGCGPAGISFALEFESICPEAKILVVEFGGGSTSKNRLDDSIVVENEINHHSPYECTNKGVGGTSATWGGRCVMYDPIDFAAREILDGGCTWDDSFYEEAIRFVPRAQELFECGAGTFDLTASTAGYIPIADGFLRGKIDDSSVERWSMPTRFGKRYRAQLERSKGVVVVKNTLVTEIIEESGAGTNVVVRAEGRREGVRFSFRAMRVVVAAGAQETTRLLLKSKQLYNRIGGPSRALGHYYQGHVSGKIASVRFYGPSAKTDYGFHRDRSGAYLRRRFQLSKETILAENLLNTAMWLDNPPYYDPVHRSGAMSVMYLAILAPWLGRRLAPPAVAHAVTRGKRVKLSRHLLNIMRELPASFLVPLQLFYSRYCRERKLPGVFLYSNDNRYAIHFHSEQVPSFENRMFLSDDGEELHIRYSITDSDIDSIIRSHEILDSWLRETNCGELEYWYPKQALRDVIRSNSKDGVHQSGTTRIGDNPKTGVVDRNLRVFGTERVYVCSSSVLPTSSQANPTFFMGVLAVRLAHHIRALCDM